MLRHRCVIAALALLLNLPWSGLATAGVVSDHASEDQVTLRSYARARFFGNNHVAGTDSQEETVVLPTTAVGTKTTAASASSVPVGVHAVGDMAEGATSLQAIFSPGGVDVFNFNVSGAAIALNAHNSGQHPADGEVEVSSYISWFMEQSPGPNQILAGKLLLPALPAVPAGVTLRMQLSQHNCCPTTADYTAPHAAQEIEMFYGYGYTLTMSLKIVAPFGADELVDFNYTAQTIDIQPGDYNRNNVVDSADYVVWRNMAGQTAGGLAADGSGPSNGIPDGVVDQFDYDYWRAHFGQSIAAGAGLGSSISGGKHGIPEPAPPMVVIIAVAAIASIRGRKFDSRL